MTVAMFVKLETKPGRKDDFLARIQIQKKITLEKEPWCQRFDIMVPKDSENAVCLYEVYADEDAFAKHGQTEHLLQYREDTADMIADRDVTLSILQE